MKYEIQKRKSDVEIWTMRLSCCGAKKVCHIPFDLPLHDLCPFILRSFDFDNDHLHKFFLSKNGQPYSDSSVLLENDNLKVRQLYPMKDKFQLYLLFDFGDDWVFKITKTLKKPFHDSLIQKPKVIEAIGENPEQYPNYD